MSEYILVTTEDILFSIEYLYSVDNYHTMIIKVKSKRFCGESSFCISNDALSNNLTDLKSMSRDLSGSTRIRDTDSDAVIDIQMKKFGKADVSGQVGGSHQDHYMCFRFESDQTMLAGLIKLVTENLV